MKNTIPNKALKEAGDLQYELNGGNAYAKYRAGLLVLRGYSVQDIAFELKLRSSTVKKYLKELREDATTQAKNLFEKELLTFLVNHNRIRMAELWRVYDASQQEGQLGVSVLILRALAAEDKQLLEMGQSLGLVHKEPETINVDGLGIDKLKEIAARGEKTRSLLRKRIEAISSGDTGIGSQDEGQSPGLLHPES